jgi:hypothetical protein
MVMPETLRRAGPHSLHLWYRTAVLQGDSTDRTAVLQGDSTDLQDETCARAR